MTPAARRSETVEERTARIEYEAKNAEVPELMGAVEVADALGVAPGNIDKVVGLPPAVQTSLSRGRIWRADLIREFAAARAARLAEASRNGADAD